MAARARAMVRTAFRLYGFWVNLGSRRRLVSIFSEPSDTSEYCRPVPELKGRQDVPSRRVDWA